MQPKLMGWLAVNYPHKWSEVFTSVEKRVVRLGIYGYQKNGRSIWLGEVREGIARKKRCNDERTERYLLKKRRETETSQYMANKEDFSGVFRKREK